MADRADFPFGFHITHDGQQYRPLGTRDYVRVDGQETMLIDWQTECPRCGVTFVITTPLNFGSPRRRCEECKAPGRRVKSDRRKLRLVAG
jgi:ribosomal protein S27AE